MLSKQNDLNELVRRVGGRVGGRVLLVNML